MFVSVSDGQRQEVSLGGGASRHCFYDLTPSSQYQISVYTQLQDIEGPPESITDMTCRSSQSAPVLSFYRSTHRILCLPSLLCSVFSFICSSFSIISHLHPAGLLVTTVSTVIFCDFSSSVAEPAASCKSHCREPKAVWASKTTCGGID